MNLVPTLYILEGTPTRGYNYWTLFAENGLICFLKMHCTLCTPCLVGIAFELEKWRFTFPLLQEEIEAIRLYEGWYCTKLQSYVIMFYLETHWSRILPLPNPSSGTLALAVMIFRTFLSYCYFTKKYCSYIQDNFFMLLQYHPSLVCVLF